MSLQSLVKNMSFTHGQVAQLVEQSTENPRVGSSILSLATSSSLKTSLYGYPKNSVLGKSRPLSSKNTLDTLRTTVLATVSDAGNDNLAAGLDYGYAGSAIEVAVLE